MGLHTLYGFLIRGTSGIECYNVVPSDSYMNWVWFVNVLSDKSNICLYKCLGFSHVMIRGETFSSGIESCILLPIGSYLNLYEL